MPMLKPCPIAHMELRRRWVAIGQLPYGQRTAARNALAAELGITPALLYRRAKASGLPLPKHAA